MSYIPYSRVNQQDGLPPPPNPIPFPPSTEPEYYSVTPRGTSPTVSTSQPTFQPMSTAPESYSLQDFPPIVPTGPAHDSPAGFSLTEPTYQYTSTAPDYSIPQGTPPRVQNSRPTSTSVDLPEGPRERPQAFLSYLPTSAAPAFIDDIIIRPKAGQVLVEDLRQTGAISTNSSDILIGNIPELGIYRRFGRLNHLNLERLQLEIQSLELEFEKSGNISGQAVLDNRFSERLRRTLSDYNTALLQAAELAKLEKPSRQYRQAVQELLRNDTSPALPARYDPNASVIVTEKIAPYVDRHLDDLIALPTGKSQGERWLRLLDPTLRQKMIGTTQAQGYDTTGVHQQRATTSHKLKMVLGKIIITIIASAIPPVAILVLWAIQDTLQRIGACIAMTVAFGLMLLALTRAEMKDIFAATAAFAAIEVVFIGTANGT